MRVLFVTWLVAAGVCAGATDAVAESASCKAQLQRQDEQCQLLAEELAAACPDGQNIKANAECSRISSKIASTCTRKPCAPPPRKKRSRSKAKGMAMGMGKAMGMSMGKPMAKGKTKSKSGSKSGEAKK